MEPPKAPSKNFCHDYFENERLEVEDELLAPINFHPRSVTGFLPRAIA
jgi:hypothetical protein